MRLIHTTSLAFEEFIGGNIPKYAILSHTWRDGEVTYADMQTPLCRRKRGWKKIEYTCAEAKRWKRDSQLKRRDLMATIAAETATVWPAEIRSGLLSAGQPVFRPRRLPLHPGDKLRVADSQVEGGPGVQHDG